MCDVMFGLCVPMDLRCCAGCKVARLCEEEPPRLIVNLECHGVVTGSQKCHGLVMDLRLPLEHACSRKGILAK